MGFRVIEEEERHGLDMSEHGASAYRGMSLLLDQEKLMTNLSDELQRYAQLQQSAMNQVLTPSVETAMSSPSQEEPAFAGQGASQEEWGK